MSCPVFQCCKKNARPPESASVVSRSTVTTGNPSGTHAPCSDSSGRSSVKTTELSSPTKMSSVCGNTADGYQSILKLNKGPLQVVCHPDIPTTLTPRGYAKLMTSPPKESYTDLVKRLKKEGKLWEDPDFPANDTSIGFKPQISGKVVWRRPKEIAPHAEFIVGGTSRFDVVQGALGDCWHVSSVCELIVLNGGKYVIYEGQKIQGPDYCGVFRFRFWRFGKWIEVLVDDRLPVDSSTGELIFAHSATMNEFWMALFEKAYSKEMGCYAHLIGGWQSEAMEDVTGGIGISHKLQSDDELEGLEKRLIQLNKSCCLIGADILAPKFDWKSSQGLVAGHAYSVTDVATVTYENKPLTIIRIRNPWGNQKEWRGAFSDGSMEWNSISAEEKKKIQLEFKPDGEFWMTIPDFKRNYSFIEVCHFGVDSLDVDETVRGKVRLAVASFSGAWKIGVNAGGCVNFPDTYVTNPQYRFTLTDPDPNDGDGKCLVIIGLMQKDVRRKSGANFNTIGFMLHQAPADQNGLISWQDLLTMQPVVNPVYVSAREAVGSYRLNPGDYVIVPTTYEPNNEINYFLRIFTLVPIQNKELDNRNEKFCIDKAIKEAVEKQKAALDGDRMIEEQFRKRMNPVTESIHAGHLKEMLKKCFVADIKGFNGFSMEMCCAMVAAADCNHNGSLEMDEVMDLCSNIRTWKFVFCKNEPNKCGCLDAAKYRAALRDCGYTVSNKVYSAMVHRYVDVETHKIPFDSFIMSLLRLNCGFETIKVHPRSNDGTMLFTDEDYLRFTCYT